VLFQKISLTYPKTFHMPVIDMCHGSLVQWLPRRGDSDYIV